MIKTYLKIFVIHFCILFFWQNKIFAQQYFANFKPKLVFDCPNFANFDNLSLSGGAFVKQQKVFLTTAEQSQMGGFWYAKEKINFENGFKTEFSFRISDYGLGWVDNSIRPGADGLAFVLHNRVQPDNVGEIGGGMGYTNMESSIAVEFDIWKNEEPNDNHIAIHSNGTDKNSSDMEACKAINDQLPFDLKDNKWHNVEIIYTPKKIMIVRVDGQNILEKALDISQMLSLNNTKVWAGFTASTGAAYAKHEIKNWKMTTFETKKEEKKEQKKEEKKEEGKKIKEREIIEKNKIKVQNNRISIEIWDEGIEDGDIVSILLNDKPIVDNYTLKRKKRKIDIVLSEGKNTLVLHAINLGSQPPNTVAISVKDGDKMHKSILNSNMKTSESLEINYMPK